jgi:hypothetical protein
MFPHVVTSLLSQSPTGGRGTSTVVPLSNVQSSGIGDGVFTLIYWSKSSRWVRRCLPVMGTTPSSLSYILVSLGRLRLRV